MSNNPNFHMARICYIFIIKENFIAMDVRFIIYVVLF